MPCRQAFGEKRGAAGGNSAFVCVRLRGEVNGMSHTSIRDGNLTSICVHFVCSSAATVTVAKNF